MAIVRAKFYVSQISQYGHPGNTNTGKTVKMMPVTSGSEENKAFWAATPTGSIEMTIKPSDVADMFQIGQEILIDFHIPDTPAASE